MPGRRPGAVEMDLMPVDPTLCSTGADWSDSFRLLQLISNPAFIQSVKFRRLAWWILHRLLLNPQYLALNASLWMLSFAECLGVTALGCVAFSFTVFRVIDMLDARLR